MDLYGTQHFSSDVSKRRGARRLPRAIQNVAWALSRSKLNAHLVGKLSKSHCTFGKMTREET